MITADQVFTIGRIGKPHGLSGEVNAQIEDFDANYMPDRCVLVIDGIRVPFVIEDCRPKHSDVAILKLEGIDSQREAQQITGCELCLLLDDCPEIAEANNDYTDEGEGLYAADLIGFTILLPQGAKVGEIIDIDDSTANTLFVVDRPGREQPLFIPVAQGNMIVDIDTDNNIVVMDLPMGLLEL